MLGIEQRPLSFFQAVKPPYDIYDSRVLESIEAWKTEMNFRGATIKVKKFFSQELYVGIQDYPPDFDDTLSNPKSSDEEKRSARESIKMWKKEREFVFWWGNDYWLDKSGEVVAS